MMSCKCSASAGCTSANKTGFTQIDRRHADYVVALAGNPNTGKSTVFNALTGLRQHTGNWAGKTVTRAEGWLTHQGKQIKLIDLPGTYSLLSSSTDEEIARNFVLFGKPEATVVVVDATSLERNLNLVLQILEITDRVVVCLNLMDEAKRKGIKIDVVKLEKYLGVPVVPTTARNGKGLDLLLDKIIAVASGEIANHPRRQPYSPQTESQINRLLPGLREILPGLPNLRWVALRLLAGDDRIREAMESGELVSLAGMTFETPSSNRLLVAQEAVT